MVDANGSPRTLSRAALTPVLLAVAPVRTIRRHGDRLPLWVALALHLATLAAWWLGGSMVAAWADQPLDATFADWWRDWTDMIASDLGHRETGWILALLLANIEIAAVSLAVCFMAWVAWDETAPASFVRSLRRLWLLTPFVAAASLTTWMVGVAILRSPMRWSRWDDLLILALIVAASTLALWTVLRALAARGRRERGDACRWPPICESCGYLLLGSSQLPACPECGLAVSQSLGDSPRVGTPWARRRQIGRPRALVRTWFDAAVHPRRLGRLVQALASDTGRGSLLAINLAVIFAITTAGWYAASELGAAANPGPLIFDWRFRMILAVFVGMATAVVTLLAWMGSASLVGVMIGWRSGRTTLPAAMQASCCLGGLTAVWLVGFWLLVSLASYLHAADGDWLEAVVARLKVDGQQLTFWTLMVFVVAAAMHFVAAHGRIVHAARYANR